jgi:hypothetical protein
VELESKKRRLFPNEASLVEAVVEGEEVVKKEK